jgi:signal transduction histidine kinase
VDKRATEPSATERGNAAEIGHAFQAARLAALGQLARGVAHDFANLLMVIAGHAELGLAQLEADSPLRGSLEHIQRAAQQANELCQDLSAFAGRTPLLLKPTNLSEQVQRIADGLARSLPAGVRIECELAQELPPVEADAGGLERLVTQLVTNAVDAIGERPGTITLRTGRMTAERPWLDAALLGEKFEPGEYMFLEVADTGSGMDASIAERMFDPFFTTRRKGNGLGLARVLGIVRAHGGAIHVTTAPQHGTTIHVLFPKGAALSESARAALRKILDE